MKQMMSMLAMMALAGMVSCAPATAQEAPVGGDAAVVAGKADAGKTVEDGKKQLARLRGKLLYKKSQIRRLEKGATSGDATLAARVGELERQRREAYVTAEPKLAALYEEQDGLDRQVQDASNTLKK